MTIEHILQNLKRELIRTFATLDEWFDKHGSLHRFKPADGGWCIAEILEHLHLTNHYLLMLIEKGQQKALRKMDHHALQTRLENYTLAVPGLLEIAEHKSFDWNRPEHHSPTGEKPLEEIRFILRDHLYRCLYVLECLPNGEGVLHDTTMTVNNLGRLDVYQYLYFLSLHIKRHKTQLEKIELEYCGSTIADGILNDTP